MRRFILTYAHWCAFAWAVVIFILCCTPGKYVPTAHWLDLLSFDKLVHAGIFFTLAALWFLYLIKKARANSGMIAIVLVACILYGGFLEIMQAKVFSQRSGDWADFIANSVGCLLAWFGFHRRKLFRLQYVA